MGLKQVLQSLGQSIDRAYERRIRAASLVREYQVGGHGHSGDHQADHEAAAAELRPGQAEPSETHAAEHTESVAVSDDGSR